MTRSIPAKITSIAEFPMHTMPENLVVRADGSILVVASPQREVWYVPVPTGDLPVKPILLHTFAEKQLAQSFVEAAPDIFYVFTYGDAVLHRFDLRGWTPGEPVSPTKVLQFEPPAGPNGSCLLAPGVMLVADCVEGLIWRIDLTDGGAGATARVWLKHDTMSAGGGHPPVKFSDTQQVPFPGINGLRYGPKTRHVYYTTSSLSLFMRVAVDQQTLEPAGEPEHLADIENVDDLCLDENLGVAYITRHPDHMIARASLEPGSSGPISAAGDPFTDALIGPTSIDWGHGPNDYGRVAYVPTDGGVIKLPPDKRLRPARLIRIEFDIDADTSH
ncbi:hypothetical protein HLH36_12775 [Gluconacetobacter aggeris]|uniref:Major royal jelly protein n=1 Tax=Gluconacetobacter aggeris TaxID=1286186 RepID=A0A7W4IUC8_9PROT|nr:hypothetical protein [Gluconacetobacter aggeris]MBB2169216.1 hypothetical protein [Gluconacetobacter aggeris]